LFPHANGSWTKKIRGKFHYFGPWANSDAALQKYLDEVDDLQAGRTPRGNRDGLTVRALVNEFLTAKTHLLDNGEIVPQTFAEYHRTCETVVSVFSKDRLVIDWSSTWWRQISSTSDRFWQLALVPLPLGTQSRESEASSSSHTILD